MFNAEKIEFTCRSFSPGGQIEAYVQAVSQIPILTAEEEKKLADKLYYDDDLDSARSLVMSHLRLLFTLRAATRDMACHRPILYKRVTSV